VSYTIGCIDLDQKKVSDGEVDQALILVKLRGDYSGLTVPQCEATSHQSWIW